MGVKVGTSCLHWSQPSLPHLKHRSFSDGSLVLKNIDHSTLFGHRNTLTTRVSNPIRRSRSASTDSSSFSDEDFVNQLQELAMRFQSSDDHASPESEKKSVSGSGNDDKIVGGKSRMFDPLCSSSMDSSSFSDEGFAKQLQELSMRFQSSDGPTESVSGDMAISGRRKMFDQHEPQDMIPAGIEWRANSVDLPMSLRMIKRKRQWQEGIREVGVSASSSVKKAFSSMVLIIRELQCFAIQTRETIMYQDLDGILARVQKEMHASFVWLFQQIFSQTPTLMVYVMILLANYSVYSMTAMAAPPPVTESVFITEYQSFNKFDQSMVRGFSLLTNSGKTEAIDGSSGGGGDFRPISSGTDGGGKFRNEQIIVPDGEREESVSGQEESRIWDSIVDETTKMQSEFRDEALDEETMKRLVSPISAKIEADEYADYFRTELSYQMVLAQDPTNPLLLANYAQFLYLVAHDYNRAEEYFKRAVKVKPSDAEALSKYASFLWQAKKDLWGAEETYLEAISADPTNSYYAANYAHFLWNTGGEETCFPLDAPDTRTNGA